MYAAWLLVVVAATTVNAQVTCDGATQFTCPDGQCIAIEQLCDFVADCASAADEANCAVCSFENGTSCGWMSPSHSSKKIAWQSTTGIIADHTQQSTTGGYANEENQIWILIFFRHCTSFRAENMKIFHCCITVF